MGAPRRCSDHLIIDVINNLLRNVNCRSVRGAIVLTALAIVAASSSASAQLPDTSGPRPRYGIFGDFLQSMHTADFDRLAGRTDIPYASRFDGGAGAGFSLGALYDLPFSETLWLMLRASYQSDAANLTTTERTTVIVGD